MMDQVTNRDPEAMIGKRQEPSPERELAPLSDAPLSNADMDVTRRRTRSGKVFPKRNASVAATKNRRGNTVKKGGRLRPAPAKTLLAVC